MKNTSSFRMAFSVIVAILPLSAFAADAVPVIQPNNGFIQSASPEWTAAHEAVPSDLADHRQYHRTAETARLSWLSLHAPDRGTRAYLTDLRIMLSTRNMFHRQYHEGLTPASSFAPSGAASSVSSSSMSTSSSSAAANQSSATSSSSSSSSVSSSSMSSSSATANQSPASLGAASTFGVLAGSTVTNTGPTTVTGDLGVSPGSAVTGFAPGTVVGGAIHTTDTSAGAAQAALTVAYNDLAGRSTNPVSVSGNLGGSTLSPGLYKSTSSLEISSGDLTLDGKGDSNAVFIFQMASTLNVSAGRHVVLIGGAKASNVFWQVGSSANLEANSVFKGSIFADQSISLQTGASVDGRLLARIGAVTLQGNTITVPAN